MFKKVLAILTAISMLLGTGMLSALAETEKVEPVDLDAYLLENAAPADAKGNAIVIDEGVAAEERERLLKSATGRALPIDRTETNEMAINGYFSYTLDSGRTVKLYVGKHAAIRTYIYIVAIPNGVEDTYAFLAEQGWPQLMDTYGEMLFVLEPGENGWGTPEEEKEYLEACLGESVANTAFDTRATTSGGLTQSGTFKLSDGTTCATFLGHTCNYYIGYGEGCALIEAWTSEHPLMVVSQALIGGETVGEEVLNASGAKVYNGINTGNTYAGVSDEELAAALERVTQAGVNTNPNFVTGADIPIPTMLAGYAENGISGLYWKKVNDCLAEGVNGVYYQALDSDAWQTLYPNEVLKEQGAAHGVSAVAFAENIDMKADVIREFLATYTRYTNTYAYSNNLCYRTEYYKVTRAARDAAESGTPIASYEYITSLGENAVVELRALESNRLTATAEDVIVNGKIYSCISAFRDYDGNGVMDPRETIVYVPDSAAAYGDQGAPVMLIWPGGGQSVSTFMDCTMWWNIAEENGCILLFLGEFCASGAAKLSFSSIENDVDFARSALKLTDEVIAADAGVKADLTRVYGTGHSLGSRYVQTMSHNTEAAIYAAVASTSDVGVEFLAEEHVPSCFFAGHTDIPHLVPEPWVTHDDVVGDDSYLNIWVLGCLKLAGKEINFTEGDKESFLATTSEWSEKGRHNIYVWNDENGVPVVKLVRTLLREHNNTPENVRMVWDYVSHFRRAENGTRYYSASCFKDNDAIVIFD